MDYSCGQLLVGKNACKARLLTGSYWKERTC